jgi:hypothetical protein
MPKLVETAFWRFPRDKQQTLNQGLQENKTHRDKEHKNNNY